MSPSVRPGRTGLALLALVLLALALRLAPIDHGLPRGYVPDNHVVRCALGMARDKDPVPPVGEYSTYPYLVPYLLLPVYGAQYALGRAAGEWQGVGEFAARAMEEPGTVQLPARVLMALFGGLTAWAVWRAARLAGLGPGAWVAGWLAATCLLDLQLSTHERPWVAVVFFGALAAGNAARYSAEGRRRDLVLSALFAGLAFACHQSGAFLLGLPAAAWLLGPLGWSGEDRRRRLIEAGALLGTFVAVGVLAGHPYYLRYGLVPDEAVVGGAQASGNLSLGGQSLPLGISLTSLLKQSRAVFGYDPVLVLLGLAGLGLALRDRRTRALGVFVAAHAAFFLTNPNPHVRYLLPALVLAALPAGLLAERLLARPAGRALLAALLAFPLVQALRFDWVLGREDTRAIAERELAALPAGSRVAIDHYGPIVDLSREALERIRDLRGELRTREAHRLELLLAGQIPEGGPGLDALPVEELFAVDPTTEQYGLRRDLTRLGTTPAEALRTLGVTHLMLADRRPGTGEPLGELADPGRLVFEVDPAGGGRPPREAFLPTEMDFPLTGLWQVERPGPWLALYRLGP